MHTLQRRKKPRRPRAKPQAIGDAGSDEELMRKFYLDADKSAVDRLYRRHREKLCRYFVRLGVDGPSREDLVQEVFVRVMATRERIPGRYVAERSCFQTWVRGIAHNLVIDQQRRQRRLLRQVGRRLDISDGQWNDCPGQIDRPIDRLIHEEQIALVRHHLGELPEGERRLADFCLAEGGRVTLRALAARFGMTVSAAFRLWSRVRQHLAERLEAEGQNSTLRTDGPADYKYTSFHYRTEGRSHLVAQRAAHSPAENPADSRGLALR